MYDDVNVCMCMYVCIQMYVDLYLCDYMYMYIYIYVYILNVSRKCTFTLMLQINFVLYCIRCTYL